MLVKTKISGLMIALMALSVPLVYADNSPDTGKPVQQEGDWHHGQHGHMMAKVLGLTEDQEKQLKDLGEKQKAAMKATFEQMKSNKEAFEAEIVKATPDMAKVNDLLTQLKTIQGQMADSHLSALLDVKKILTPEQFAGYMALKKEREMKMHKMGHKNWGHKGDKDHDSDSRD